MILSVALGCGGSVGAGPDAGGPDAGLDAGADAGRDAGSDGGTTDAGPDAGALTDGGTLIVVHYPMPTGHTLSLRGDVAPLNWNTGLAMTQGPNDTWSALLPITQAVEVKPLYDDTTWAIGPNWTVPAGVRADLWPHFFTMNGTVTEVDNVASAILGDSRSIWVYTPPSYAENADEVFPVAYFQDGQNLFYADLSFSGVAWNLQGAMDQGALDGTIHEAILVGIANDANRIWEYTPNNGGYDGGGANEYLAFMGTELKPMIDQQYRTEPDVAHTMICGSSLGGLLSAYAGLTQASTYGLVGILSPSTWWDCNWLIGAVMQSLGMTPQPLRLYLDSGNAGTDDDDVGLTASLDQAYRDAGMPIDYLVQDGGQHSEYYWAQRVPGTLAFLLGPREFTDP